MLPRHLQSFETPLSDEQYAADSARADRCLEHMQCPSSGHSPCPHEETVLRPVLIDVDAWGRVRVAAMDEERSARRWPG